MDHDADMDLTGKVAVVTGGASGIGRCLVRQLAAAGAHVVIADIDADAVAALAAELEGASGRVMGQRVDVTREESVTALADAVFAAHETVHLLFNNAGVGVKEAKRPMWGPWDDLVDPPPASAAPAAGRPAAQDHPIPPAVPRA